MDPQLPSHPHARSREQFPDTCWSVVLAAADQGLPHAVKALGQLYADYWYPLYAFARRRGNAALEAEDLTQAFFLRLVEKQFLTSLKREGGRFRSFLLTAFKHFLSTEWERQTAQKRGGSQPRISCNDAEAELRYQVEPVENVTPETLFARRWATTVLDRVFEQVRRDYEKGDRAELFDELRAFLGGKERGTGYAEFALRHGISEGAVKVAVHRLRKRYGELLRAEVARTVSDPAEIDDEIRHLIAAACGQG